MKKSQIRFDSLQPAKLQVTLLFLVFLGLSHFLKNGFNMSSFLIININQELFIHCGS